MRALSFIFALFLFSSNSQAVIGGRIDDSADTAVIQIALSGNSYCTATKIGKDLLLTAAHCFNQDSKLIGFSSKVQNAKFEFFELKAQDIIIHPSYLDLGDDTRYEDSLTVFDMSLVKVVPTSEFEKLSVMEMDFNVVSPGEELSFVGYGCEGSVNNLDGYIPRRKIARSTSLALSALLLPHGIMSEFYGEISDEIYKFNILTPGNKMEPRYASLCYGDSGGPILKNDKLVGINSSYTFSDITSSGGTQTGVSKINLHSRLSQVEEWIKSQIEKLDK